MKLSFSKLLTFFNQTFKFFPGRILKGQRSGHSGEETVSILDEFENVGLSKVYASG